MNAHISDFSIPGSETAGWAVPATGTAPAAAVQAAAAQWAALHDAAAAVAGLAGVEPLAPTGRERDFTALVMTLSAWRLELMRDRLDDIAAIMRCGLAALLAANAQGQKPTAAALQLWHEFLHARDAVLDLTA